MQSATVPKGLLDHYRECGLKQYNRSRYLEEILSQSDDWFDYTHDCIQCLFPNKRLSGVLPNAPLLDKETVELFCNDRLLQDHLQASLKQIFAVLWIAINRRLFGKTG
jgi:hypothetical protein